MNDYKLARNKANQLIRKNKRNLERKIASDVKIEIQNHSGSMLGPKQKQEPRLQILGKGEL